MKLAVTVHGHACEVSAALLAAELQRDGPPPKLQLLEAILRHAPRAQAARRLQRMLAHPVPKGGEPAAMYAALGLLDLSALCPEAAGESLDCLLDFAARTGGAAGATVAAGVMLLRGGPAGICPGPNQRPADPVAGAAGFDAAILLRQSPRAICALRQPSGLVPAMRPLSQAWMAALDQAARTQGVHAFRGLLGDVAEALYRLLYRSAPPCRPEDLLSEAERSTLLDTITFELPGTADFLAARAMVWVLGALAPPDDAAVAAIERARDRFRNEAFHADCAAILSGDPWPPRRAAGADAPEGEREQISPKR